MPTEARKGYQLSVALVTGGFELSWALEAELQSYTREANTLNL